MFTCAYLVEEAGEPFYVVPLTEDPVEVDAAVEV